jgi:signal transduction histidine kinase
VRQSALIKTRTCYIAVVPFIYEQTVKGVIELGCTEPLLQVQQEFLQQILPSIAISVNAAESRMRLQILLQQSQTQSEELQVQQEELQQTNEELQSQSEELRVQQEELRQVNDELKNRTEDLERQQEEVHQKNLGLEKAQQAVEAKAKELELASKYKSEFLANMPHELRTPLNSLLILAQLLMENKRGNLDEKQIEYARTIYSAGNDLLTLINEILDLSKIEAGKIEVHLEEVVINDLIEAIRQKFQHIAEEKRLTFNIVVAEGMPPVLHTDLQRVKQIINNLLSNAFKFTTIGGVQLTMSQINDTFVFSVTDSGIGIPSDKL